MSYLSSMIGALTQQAVSAPPPAMGAPAFLQLAAAADILLATDTAATITSESVSPPANANVYVWFVTRRDATLTHDSMTAGFATVAGFAKLEDIEIEEPASNFLRLSLWGAVTTATPGSGTIVGTASGTAYQRMLGGAVVANVGSVVDTASASNTTGSTVALTFTPSATTGDVALVGSLGRGDSSGTLTFSDGLTGASNSPLNNSTNMTLGLGSKVSPASTQTTSGLASNQAHITMGVLLRGQAFSTEFSSEFN